MILLDPGIAKSVEANVLGRYLCHIVNRHDVGILAALPAGGAETGGELPVRRE